MINIYLTLNEGSVSIEDEWIHFQWHLKRIPKNIIRVYIDRCIVYFSYLVQQLTVISTCLV